MCVRLSFAHVRVNLLFVSVTPFLRPCLRRSRLLSHVDGLHIWDISLSSISSHRRRPRDCVRVLCAAIECVTEPETVESYEQERGDDGGERGGLCYFAHDDVEVCGDAERERDHRGEQHATGEARS